MKRYHQTIFDWTPENYSRVIIPTPQGESQECLIQMMVRTKEHPSGGLAEASLLFSGYAEKPGDERDLVISKMIETISRGAINTSKTGANAVDFFLVSGEEFCDAAIVIGQALTKAFKIHNWGLSGSRPYSVFKNFRLRQITWVQVPNKDGEGLEWITLSDHLIRKHSIKEFDQKVPSWIR